MFDVSLCWHIGYHANELVNDISLINNSHMFAGRNT